MFSYRGEIRRKVEKVKPEDDNRANAWASQLFAMRFFQTHDVEEAMRYLRDKPTGHYLFMRERSFKNQIFTLLIKKDRRQTLSFAVRPDKDYDKYILSTPEGTEETYDSAAEILLQILERPEELDMIQRLTLDEDEDSHPSRRAGKRNEHGEPPALDSRDESKGRTRVPRSPSPNQAVAQERVADERSRQGALWQSIRQSKKEGCHRSGGNVLNRSTGVEDPKAHTDAKGPSRCKRGNTAYPHRIPGEEERVYEDCKSAQGGEAFPRYAVERGEGYVREMASSRAPRETASRRRRAEDRDPAGRVHREAQSREDPRVAWRDRRIEDESRVYEVAWESEEPGRRRRELGEESSVYQSACSPKPEEPGWPRWELGEEGHVYDAAWSRERREPALRYRPNVTDPLPSHHVEEDSGENRDVA